MAERLFAVKYHDLKRASEIIKEGGVVALPFNGVYGLFGHVRKPEVIQKIHEAKNRPPDKKLITVYLPEDIRSFAEVENLTEDRSLGVIKDTPYLVNRLEECWRDIHALGLIFPASEKAPQHLVVQGKIMDTILCIWTEHIALRVLMEMLRKQMVEGLVGTSANKSGEATHFNPDALWEDFKGDIDAIVVDYFDHLPAYRKKSTSIVDLTHFCEEQGRFIPRLHRLGNTTVDEIEQVFKKYGILVGDEKLITDERAIIVKQRDLSEESSQHTLLQKIS